MVDISMADVAGGGFAVEATLAKQPIYVIRYQGSIGIIVSIVNYTAKSKLWNVPCSCLLDPLLWKEV